MAFPTETTEEGEAAPRGASGHLRDCLESHSLSDYNPFVKQNQMERGSYSREGYEAVRERERMSDMGGIDRHEEEYRMSRGRGR